MKHQLYSILYWPDSQEYVGHDDIPFIDANAEEDDQACMIPVKEGEGDEENLFIRLDWPDSQPWNNRPRTSKAVKHGFNHEVYVPIPVMKAEEERLKKASQIKEILDGMTVEEALETVFSLQRSLVAARAEKEVLALMDKVGAKRLDFSFDIPDEDDLFIDNGDRVSVIRKGALDNVMIEHSDDDGCEGEPICFGTLSVGDADDVLCKVRSVIDQVEAGLYEVEDDGSVVVPS